MIGHIRVNLKVDTQPVRDALAALGVALIEKADILDAYIPAEGKAAVLLGEKCTLERCPHTIFMYSGFLFAKPPQDDPAVIHYFSLSDGLPYQSFRAAAANMSVRPVINLDVIADIIQASAE